MAIQLFRPNFKTTECLSQIKECFDAGWTGMGFKTRQFEEAWKEYTGLGNALFLNSCTAALNLAVYCLKQEFNWDDDSEIISTPNTFVSTNHAIHRNNLKVVFADIDQTMCLDCTSVEKNITDKTRAIMYVGIGGNAGNYKEIVSLCEKYNLKLILDAAHMAGTKLNGCVPGKEADAVCYSFQAVKNLATGDSGMLCFKDGKLDEIARKVSWLGINKDTYNRYAESSYKWEYDVEYVGEKYNGNSIMAAIALAQLPFLDEENKIRNEIANKYRNAFAKYDNKIKMVKIADDCISSCHLFQIIVEDRNGLIDFLNKNEIYPGVHYVDNTRYRMYSYDKNKCPYAAYISDHVLSLPMHTLLTEQEVELIIDKVIQYVCGEKNE